MTKRMLIDATHAEETRVVVLDGNRLDDFDVETASKKQLKGNIYLAKVVRVEPSLQAAFVEYGGNRHGFLAFSEIHPDYYQIPVADRQRLIAMQEEEARAEEEAEEAEHTAGTAAPGHAFSPSWDEPAGDDDPADAVPPELHDAAASAEMAPAALPTEAEDGDATPPAQPALVRDEVIRGPALDGAPELPLAGASDPQGAPAAPMFEFGADLVPETMHPAEPLQANPPETRQEITADSGEETERGTHDSDLDFDSVPSDAPPPETIGGEQEEGRERRMPPRFMRNYKIQEVIRRRQIMLIQVVKEERGTKGAALTTYISLAGRYSVLMPNSPRGGGISRKITSAADRKRLKEVMTELDIPKGMGLIVRTAGANRPKPEIKRDCEYLLRLWDDIREHTMRSVAPALIYEEANLIKRAIRDVYSRDIDEVLVDGEEGWKNARDFMRMLMPTHVKHVQMWRGTQKLFASQQVEAQLDAMFSPTVQLRSGGYLVINQAEALVAIDVNSGRATRERNIEETALRTNLEAADEVARQLRLRDLAGLIVIDFIDMEAKKHNAAVERRLKDALKSDRARIQVGHISHFGLMEMSRQRLRPSLAETSFIVCPHCNGTGLVRSTESAAMHVLRQVEEEGGKRRAAEITVHVAGVIALYILNHKRAWLGEIEQRHAMSVTFAADDQLLPPQTRIERLRAQVISDAATAISQDSARALPPAERNDEAADTVSDEQPEIVESRIVPPAPGLGPQPDLVVARSGEARAVEAPTEIAGEDPERRRRRRRRRRGGRRDDQLGGAPAGTPEADTDDDASEAGAAGGDDWEEPGIPTPEQIFAGPDELPNAPIAPVATESGEPGEEAASGSSDADAERSRRGRRGGRRRRRDQAEEPVATEPVLPYAGPTPADPFGGQGFDIFDILEAQEARLHEALASSGTPPVSPESRAEAEAPAAAPQGAAPDLNAPQVPAPEIAALEIASAEPGILPPAEPAAVDPTGSPDLTPDSAPSAMIESRTADHAESILPETNPAESIPPESAGPEQPEAPAAPIIKPVIIDTDSLPTERKRGWWRR